MALTSTQRSSAVNSEDVTLQPGRETGDLSMRHFIEVLFSKHVLLISDSYGIFRLKGRFYTTLLGDRDGAIHAFKYFISVHAVLLSLISLGASFNPGYGLSLIKSELYVVIAVITVLPNIVAFKCLAVLRRTNLPVYGAVEIVFYAASYLFVLLLLSVPVGLVLAALLGVLYLAIGETFSFWHWAIVIAVLYSITEYTRYQLLWLQGKYGIPMIQSFMAIVIGFAAIPLLSFAVSLLA
jgi:hypothetical protein